MSGWKSALKKAPAQTIAESFARPVVPLAKVDLRKVVTVDFETYFDVHYTLKKLSTSEYVRHELFKVQMVGIKIGKGKTRVLTWAQAKKEFAKIDWKTTGLLCHNTAFDGFIMSHHFGIVPAYYYDTLSMARGLHSNEISGDLDTVAKFYGGEGKVDGFLEKTKGVREWPKELWAEGAVYCGQDIDECFRIFECMLKAYPQDELDLIDLTIRMFCDPVLLVDTDRVAAEYEREVKRREDLFFNAVNPKDYDVGGKKHDPAFFKERVLKTKAERALEGTERRMLIAKRLLGNNEFFAGLLQAEGIDAPVKLSPAWLKRSPEEREATKDEQWAYAFAKDDLDFIGLPDDIDQWRGQLDPNKRKDVPAISTKQDRIRNLVEARLAVKSTGNITRAERFMEAGKNGMRLPVGYAYYRAHTGRWGGANKMNMQNLARGGELRLSILAPKGFHLGVVDSGQIEARVNAWLWDQFDLLDAFRAADTGTGADAYCRFASLVYGRQITKDDKDERFLGKVCVAEGELVLTDRGPVPIELISKQDRLWDGVEWVSHDGLVDQGIKEVITYGGLTATPDHEVFTSDGRIVPLGQAASEMVGLACTGVEGQAVRFCDDHVVADTPRKRLSVRQGAMRSVGHHQVDQPQQLEARQDDFVSEERPTPGAQRRGAGATVRRDQEPMQALLEPSVGFLWRSRHPMSFQDSDELHPVGVDPSSAQGLRGSGDRPHRQRRALCAGELAAGNTDAAGTQPTQYQNGDVEGKESSVGGISESLQSQLDVESSEPRADRGSNPCKVRVYDIANAGPRRRFTVSGRLVFNCVLGLGYQMGAPKLQMTLAKGALGGPPIYLELAECHRIVNTYRAANYRIRDGWAKCTRIIEDMAAGRSGSWKCISWEKETIWLPNGMSLKYPDLRKTRNEEKDWDEWSYQAGDMRSKIYGGLLCENLVQALARIIVGMQMLTISRKHRIVMTTHDEAVALLKKVSAPTAMDFMLKTFKTPLPWCKDIPLNAEGGHAENYSK